MRRNSFSRHFWVVLVILILSVLIGFAYNGFMTLIERSTHPREYRAFVEEYADAYAVPESVIYAVIRSESSFDASAVSSAGAIGLMQLMPSTYEWICSLTGELYEERLLYDPETNIRCGTYLLSILYSEYGVWETVYAAYNAGIGNVNKWLEDPAYAGENGTLEKIPFQETRNFVNRVSSAKEIYERLYDLDGIQ